MRRLSEYSLEMNRMFWIVNIPANVERDFSDSIRRCTLKLPSIYDIQMQSIRPSSDSLIVTVARDLSSGSLRRQL
jgi:hypothetical protein